MLNDSLTTPTVISETTVSVTYSGSTYTFYFAKYSNGLKRVGIADANVSTVRINSTDGLVPAAYRPMSTAYIAGMNKNYTPRIMSVTNTGQIWVYSSDATGMYASGYYL